MHTCYLFVCCLVVLFTATAAHLHDDSVEVRHTRRARRWIPASVERRDTHTAAHGIGGPMFQHFVAQQKLPIATYGDVNKLMHAVCERIDQRPFHTYQGFQGAAKVWPSSIVQSAASASADKDEKTNTNGEVSSSKTTTDDNRATKIDGADYSMSPSFLPAPNTTGYGAWQDAIAKARTFIQQWTLEEMVNLTTGVGWQKGEKPHCVGNIAPNHRLNFPGLCLEDGPAGVRLADLTLVYPAGVSTAATFSPALARQRGEAMGHEFYEKGVNIALGPGMNMHRNAAGGRNWEYFGADPYLSGEMAHETIIGIQSQGVQATAKHFVGSEQEIGSTTHSSNIDARTLHEVYVHPFMRSIQAGVSAIMCAYPLLNNSYACQNSELLNEVAKHQLGFSGYIMSDWGAAHSGVANALSGLDMMMPGDYECCIVNETASFWRSNLTMAVRNGSVPEWRVRDMGTRILAGWYLLGQDKSYHDRKPNFDAFDFFYGEHKNVVTPKASQIAREIGAASAVLLKNTRGALPLRTNMRKMTVIGEDAAPAFRGANAFVDRGGIDGVVSIGWGSGSADHSYLISPYEALQSRAREHNIGFYWMFDNQALGRASSISDERLGVDAAIVFVHSDSGEGYIIVDGNTDRKNLTLWNNGDELIKNVSAYQGNTIVVIHAPGQVDMEAWISNPNVTAVVHAHFPGSEAGNAIADVLFGDVNPSGRLPYTIAKKRSDAPDVVYFPTKNINESQLYYSEGLAIDYRHFDKAKIEPRFPFGFGLSYTSFAYDNLRGHWLDASDWNARPWSWPIPAFMFEDVYTISFDVRNTGARDGHEVPQVYLGFAESSGEPPKVLRKFDRVPIKAGETKTVEFKLNRYDLSTWSNEQTRWIKPAGDAAVYVGASSRDIRLQMTKM